MVFSSPLFCFIFLPILLFFYYCIRYKRNLILLFFSMLFYFWGEPKNILLIWLLIILNYVIGIGIAHYDRTFIIKRGLFVLGCILDLGCLLYYKYSNFIIENINTVLGYSIPYKNIALPLGISFFIFQIMSYIIDVYNKRVNPQSNLSDLALYVTLFPQLIAGPIVRYIDLEKQISNRKESISLFYEGSIKFCIGFAKKILLADNLAILSDFAFNNNISDSISAWIGILAYTLQIYYDFSGYSDMAIGLGLMFGFTFMENFKYPYSSKSIKDFWRRWHISLSTWFRDYVYIPLGGNKCPVNLQYRNLIVVFFLTGLWHGASWNFILWGLWHGAFLILEKMLSPGLSMNGSQLVSRLYTMLVVMIGWVFFRADNLQKAFDYISLLFSFNFSVSSSFFGLLDYEKITVIVIGMLLSFPLVEYTKQRLNTNKNIIDIVADLAVIVLFITSVFYMCGSGNSPFLYFRF